jgi:transposase
MEARTFRVYDREQCLLLPPSLRDWLPEGHPVFFISEVVDGLDLSDLISDYDSPDGKGAPPYHPRLLLGVLVYGYATGVFSSRKLAAKCVDDVAFRYLAAQQTPDFRTFIKFRSRHLERFRGLFVQVVEVARESGLVKLGHLSIDGTKLKANASKHKAMSYKRMLEEERKLREEIDELLKRAGAVDEEEDEEYGEADGRSLPEELSRREKRLEVIEAAKRRLEERAERRAEEEADRREKEARVRETEGKPPKRYRKPPDQTPKAKEQENFTDPESRIMLDGGTKGFIQGYNCQIAVDAEHQIIVAADLDNNAGDAEKLLPMLDAAVENTGEHPRILTADGGYKSEGNFAGLKEREVDGFVACGREAYDPRIKCPQGRIPKSATLTDRMVRKLLTKRGRKIYRMRKHIPEPVIGWIKSVLGFRQFSLRGERKALGEWMLVCTAMNLRRMANPC